MVNMFSTHRFSRVLGLLLLPLLSSCAATTGHAAAQLPALNWTERSDWLNVKKGATPAVGDGVADDTDAIQKTLDKITDGVTVYIPAGTYRITHMLTATGRALGVTIIGNGRDTRLVWDGPNEGTMLQIDGIPYSRYQGFVLDGAGKAAVGMSHSNTKAFETEVRCQDIGFINCTKQGLFENPSGHYALAEILFENCLFANCGTGASFRKFNDYDYTFDGCEFRGCNIGIDCVHGNFYIRNCHFENDHEVDIIAKQEHGSSVRRCTSNGSVAFISYSAIGPLTIQDCHVSNWANPQGAVTLNGAPVMILDTLFDNPPDDEAPVKPAAAEPVIVSGSSAPGCKALLSPASRVYEIPAGLWHGRALAATQSFLQETVPVPSKLFDAKVDFGAKGDGRTDDTAAVQKTIDAARAYGQDALAYLPSGRYVIKNTLLVTGANYRLGGTGFRTGLMWAGAAGGTMVEVRDPQNVTLENINVGNHDVGAMNNSVDIRQTDSGAPSKVTYDGVEVYGIYDLQPLNKGILFDHLGHNAVVLMKQLEGNMRFEDSARATVLANCSYEGSLTIEGKDVVRDGFLGFETRLATEVKYGLLIKDNLSIVMSDFYVEQSENGYFFAGSADLPAGRVTMQGAKVHFFDHKGDPTKDTALGIDNYKGEIFFGPDQFYQEPKLTRITQTGDNAVTVYLIGVCFYDTMPDIHITPAARVLSIGNYTVGMKTVHYDGADTVKPLDFSQLTNGMDDLRKLGDLDLKLNHPGIVP